MSIELSENQYNSFNQPCLFPFSIALGTSISGYYSGFEPIIDGIAFNREENPVWNSVSEGFRLRTTLLMPDSTEGSVNFTFGSKITSSQVYGSGYEDLIDIENGQLSIKQRLSIMKSSDSGNYPGLVFEDTNTGIGLDDDNVFRICFEDATTGLPTSCYNFGEELFQTVANISLDGDLYVGGDIFVTGASPWLTDETDPVFTAHAAFGIDSTQISSWDTAVNWGDHSMAGYLTAVPELLNQSMTLSGSLIVQQSLDVTDDITSIQGEIILANMQTLAGGLAIQTSMIILQDGEINGEIVPAAILGASIYGASNSDAQNIMDCGFISTTSRLIDSTGDPNEFANQTYHNSGDYLNTFAATVFSDYVMDGTDVVNIDSSAVAGVLLQASENHSFGSLGTRLILANTLNGTDDINVGAILDGDGSFKVKGDLIHQGDNLAFFDGTSAAQPVITGATDSEKITSIITALTSLNLVTVT